MEISFKGFVVLNLFLSYNEATENSLIRLFSGKKLEHRKVLWRPSEERANSSSMKKYMNWLNENHSLEFSSYDEFWNWSINDLSFFWQTIWDYFELKSETKFLQQKVILHRKKKQNHRSRKLSFYIRNIISPKFSDSYTNGTPKPLKNWYFYVKKHVFKGCWCVICVQIKILW